MRCSSVFYRVVIKMIAKHVVWLSNRWRILLGHEILLERAAH